MFEYYKILNSNTYFTPWYSTNWVLEPYTNFQMYLNREHSRVYETKSATGVPWVCKETKIGDKKFWTILEKTL
jgi:hypothetical protein